MLAALLGGANGHRTDSSGVSNDRGGLRVVAGVARRVQAGLVCEQMASWLADAPTPTPTGTATATPAPRVVPAGELPLLSGRVTYYCCTAPNYGSATYCPGDTTASGRPLELGDSGRVGACSFAYRLGETVDLPDGRRILCVDRGRLDEYGVAVDVWVYECP